MSRHQQIGLAVATMVFASLSLSGQVPGVQIPSEPTILQRSPFIPPDWNPPRTNQPVPQEAKEQVTGYEFRGVFQLNNEYRFLVSQPKSRSGKWVRVGEEYEDFEVRNYNAESETLTLFYNSKEEAIKLAEVEANPSPMPVSGQVRAAATGGAAGDERTVRRTIRPTTRTEAEPGAAPPPPAWLQRLREEAAARRAQANSGSSSASGPGGSGPSDGRNNPSVGNLSPPNTDPGQQPNYTPPPPPEELLNMDIPPPPTSLPPPPSPEVQQLMLESFTSGTPGN